MRRDFPALTVRRPFVQLHGLVAVLVISLAIASSVRAEEDPAGFVQRLGDQATVVLADTSLTRAERHAAFRRMLEAYFDIDRIGRVVLGRHWRGATPSEQRTYRDLFEAYVLASYGRRLEDYAGETLEVGRVRDSGRKDVIVSSRLHRPRGAPIALDWRLRGDDGSWRVVDLIVEGVSLTMTHRSEFNAVIQHGGGGIEPLLVKLRAMVVRLEGVDTAQPSKL